MAKMGWSKGHVVICIWVLFFSFQFFLFSKWVISWKEWRKEWDWWKRKTFPSQQQRSSQRCGDNPSPNTSTPTNICPQKKWNTFPLSPQAVQSTSVLTHRKSSVSLFFQWISMAFQWHVRRWLQPWRSWSGCKKTKKMLIFWTKTSPLPWGRHVCCSKVCVGKRNDVGKLLTGWLDGCWAFSCVDDEISWRSPCSSPRRWVHPPSSRWT